MSNSPNTANRQLQKQLLFPYWSHPDVKFYASEWELLRDCDMGEKQIKTKGQDYLPRLESFTDDDYIAYLDRAVFYNMVTRTKGGMVGSIFRRLPNIQNKPIKLDLNNIGQEGEDFRTFAKLVAQEVVHMGRCGVLLDRTQDDTKDITTLPYLTIYIAESILTWSTAMIKGRKQLTKVILREIIEDQDPATGYVRYLNRFRVLELEDQNGKYVYVQKVFHPTRTVAGGLATGVNSNATGTLAQPSTTALKDKSGYFNADSDGRTTGSAAGDANIFGTPDDIITPTIHGVPFDYIPFICFGPQNSTIEVEKPPLLDIARLNISHYRSYAHLEHGRYYTALPVYWTQVEQNDGGGVYTIGPSVVWEIPLNARAGLIEYNGSGLKYLSDALGQKEDQISALGGRLIGENSTAGSARPNYTAQLSDRNEQAMLLSVALTLDSGFTRMMRWFSNWIDVATDQIDKFTIEFNKDFIFSNISAREFRAIEAMYLDGVLPIEILFDYFKRAEVIPDWVDIDEFKVLLSSAASFPDNPNFEAREEGYTDASAKVVSDDKELDRENAIQLQELKNQGIIDVAEVAAGDPLGQQDNQLANQKDLATHNQKLGQKTADQNQVRQIALQKVQARLNKVNASGPPDSLSAPQNRQAALVRAQTLQRLETSPANKGGMSQENTSKAPASAGSKGGQTQELTVKMGNTTINAKSKPAKKAP